MDEKAFNTRLIVTNMDEFDEHLDRVIEFRGNKTNEELFEEAATFDFKFDLVPYEDDYDDEDIDDYADDDDEFTHGDMKFIWGIKSWDDLSRGNDANFYTMNDIDIVYDRESKMYMLGIETAYMFNSHADECKYLRRCLDAFTKYMDDNGLKKNEPYCLFMSTPCVGDEAETIEELYVNFKIFVDGFCNQDINMNEGGWNFS